MCDYVDVKFIQVSSGNYYFVDVVYVDSENNLYCNHVIPCQFRKNELAVSVEENSSFFNRKDQQLIVSDLGNICVIPIKIERKNIILEARAKKEVVENLLKLLENKTKE